MMMRATLTARDVLIPCLFGVDGDASTCLGSGTYPYRRLLPDEPVPLVGRQGVGNFMAYRIEDFGLTHERHKD
jgi:hypothetical protein